MTFTYAANAGEAGAPQPSRSTSEPVQNIDSEQLALESRLSAEYNAEAVCKHLRQRVPIDCKLYVLKQDYLIDVEKPRKLITNSEYAAAE